MEIPILVWIVCGIAAGFMASGRGSGWCLWFGLGFLLGPFALHIPCLYFARLLVEISP